MDTRGATAVTVDHCGFYASSATAQYGIQNGAELTVTNSWCVENTINDWWTGGTAGTGSYNASLDGTSATDYATGDVDIVASSNEFTSPSATWASFDFTLKDSLLNGAGTGALATDITGATRDGDPDIGPFNFAAAAPFTRKRRHVGFAYG